MVKENFKRSVAYLSMLQIYDNLERFKGVLHFTPKSAIYALKVLDVKVGNEPDVLFYNDYFALCRDGKGVWIKSLEDYDDVELDDKLYSDICCKFCVEPS